MNKRRLFFNIFDNNSKLNIIRLFLLRRSRSRKNNTRIVVLFNGSNQFIFGVTSSKSIAEARATASKRAGDNTNHQASED